MPPVAVAAADAWTSGASAIFNPIATVKAGQQVTVYNDSTASLVSIGIGSQPTLLSGVVLSPGGDEWTAQGPAEVYYFPGDAKASVTSVIR